MLERLPCPILILMLTDAELRHVPNFPSRPVPVLVLEVPVPRRLWLGACNVFMRLLAVTAQWNRLIPVQDIFFKNINHKKTIVKY